MRKNTNFKKFNKRSRPLAFKWSYLLVIGAIIALLTKCGSDKSDSIWVEIPEGSSLKETAEILDKAGLISYSTLFRLKYRDEANKIQAGNFLIPKNSSSSQIITILSTNQNQTRITIPEGSTIKDIDKILTDANLITSGEFLDCSNNCNLPESFIYFEAANLAPGRNLEGFLFPDTYFVNKNSFQSEQFLSTLLTTFSQKAPKQLQDLTPQEQYDAIKMASIIEEEVRTDPDRAIISGIYWKRLTNDWRLEADATLLYEKNNRSITAQDLASDSAYNTRRNKGFPPTPISNPGVASIEAALNPIDTNYWFYLTPPNSNEVIYASTNEEHEVNKDRYLR